MWQLLSQQGNQINNSMWGDVDDDDDVDELWIMMRMMVLIDFFIVILILNIKFCKIFLIILIEIYIFNNYLKILLFLTINWN